MHILHKEIVVELPKMSLITPARKFGFGGNEVRGILRDLNGNILQDTGWIKNSWTTYGAQRLGNLFTWMSIGTGTGATLPGDVDLKSVIYGPVQSGAYQRANIGSPTYAFWKTQYERINAGSATGTITEVGMHSGLGLGTLMCRAEITPIVKGADNVLDMWYKTTCTPDLVDKTGSILIDGINYDWTVRPYNCDLFTEAFNGVAWGNSASANSNPQNADPQTGQSSAGESWDAMSIINGVVDYPGKIRNWSTFAGLDNGNFTIPGGIKSCYTRLDFGQYIGTDSGISVGFVATDGPDIGSGVPKLDSQYFTVDWNCTWDSA